MLTYPSMCHAAICSTMGAMTYRVYLRWPYQRVTDRTVTDNRAVADLAFRALVARLELAGQGALGVALTEDGKQLMYHDFANARGVREDSGGR